MVSMNSQNESTADLLETSTSSHHFGQLVWAKLASAPFWPAVIFTEENQDWIRHKGKSTYVHVFFFGETAERSWIQTTRILPFVGAEKFAQQRSKWRRKMKSKMNDEQRLTAKDRSNLNKAIKQTTKLSEFSLRKRITVLKNEWWYWEDDDVIPLEPSEEIVSEESQLTTLKEQEIDTEAILRLLNANANELDEIVCLSDLSAENHPTPSIVRQSSSVCFHPLTSNEEELIVRQMIKSTDPSFIACRRVAENEYLLCIQKNLPLTSFISEHWFYLFVFRHGGRLARLFPQWIDEMKALLVNSPFLTAMHISQIQSLIVLFQHLPKKNHEQ